jgi:hypothetical protein
MPVIEPGQTALECADCEKELPIEEFRVEHKKTYPDGNYRSTRCRVCRMKFREAQKLNKAESGSKSIIRPARNPRTKFYWYAKRYYGLDPEQADDLIKDSSGLCAICGNQFRPDRYEPHIDHCHSTNKVRDLLCRDCNLLVGHLENNVGSINKAIQYIKHHGKRNR